jgi:hypothetical protein
MAEIYDRDPYFKEQHEGTVKAIISRESDSVIFHGLRSDVGIYHR